MTELIETPNTPLTRSPNFGSDLRRELNAFAIIAHRDLLKLLRDRTRLVTSLIFPMIFIGILGGTFQANLGSELGYNFLTFTFTGVLAQTMFQSTAIGIVSLIEDRENDFRQEIFVSPVSRYSIVFGKILGESLVSLVQAFGIVVFAFIIGVPITLIQLPVILLTSFIICLFGGAFGVVLMANLNSQRAANQIFPFIMLPQYFLSGVFAPIRVLPGILRYSRASLPCAMRWISCAIYFMRVSRSTRKLFSLVRSSTSRLWAHSSPCSWRGARGFSCAKSRIASCCYLRPKPASRTLTMA